MRGSRVRVTQAAPFPWYEQTPQPRGLLLEFRNQIGVKTVILKADFIGETFIIDSGFQIIIIVGHPEADIAPYIIFSIGLQIEQGPR